MGESGRENIGQRRSIARDPFQSFPTFFYLLRRRRTLEHRSERLHRREIRRRHLLGYGGIHGADVPFRSRSESHPPIVALPSSAVAGCFPQRTPAGAQRRFVSDGDLQRNRMPQRMGKSLLRKSTATGRSRMPSTTTRTTRGMKAT